MAEMTQCPECASWNPPQVTRCRTCGTELRGPQISFNGPPADAPRPRSAEEERAEEEKRAAEVAEGMRAQRDLKREEDRKRREYTQRKERLEQEIRGGRPRGREPTAGAGTELGPERGGASETGGAPGQAPASADSSSIPRVSTYVEGLDRALGGGFPAGFVIVLGGSPGTMKSSLAFHVLAGNARAGHRGLYLAFEQETRGLLQQMEGLGLGLREISERMKIVDAPQLRAALSTSKGDWLAALRGLVTEARRQDGLDLLVIDSLDGLDAAAAFQPRRRELFRLFEWLRELGVTSFVIAERPDYAIQGAVFHPRYDEDFLADGVVSLRLHAVSELEVQRRLRIVKMRGTRHETAYLAFHVGEGGFEVGRVLGM